MARSDDHAEDGKHEVTHCPVCGGSIAPHAAICLQCYTPQNHGDAVTDPRHLPDDEAGRPETLPFQFERDESPSGETKIKKQSADPDLPWSDDDFARISVAAAPSVRPSPSQTKPASTSPTQAFVDEPESLQAAPRLPLDKPSRIRPSPVRATTPAPPPRVEPLPIEPSRVEVSASQSPAVQSPPSESLSIEPPQPSPVKPPHVESTTPRPPAAQSPWAKPALVPQTPVESPPVQVSSSKPMETPTDDKPARKAPSFRSFQSGKPPEKKTLPPGEPILIARPRSGPGSAHGSQVGEAAPVSPETSAQPRLFSDKRDLEKPAFSRPSRLILASVATVAVLYLAISQQRPGALPDMERIADALDAASPLAGPDGNTGRIVASNSQAAPEEISANARPAASTPEQASASLSKGEASPPVGTGDKVELSAAPAAKEVAPDTRPAPLQPAQEPRKTIVATGAPPSNLVAPGTETQAKADYVSATGELVLEIQMKLAALGYAPGPLDGALRSRTRDAIRAFQEDAGLEATGAIDPGLLERLRQTQRVRWQLSG